MLSIIHLEVEVNCHAPLGKHFNDMAVQLILKLLYLPKEIIARRVSAEISVEITLLGSGESFFWGLSYPKRVGV